MHKEKVSRREIGTFTAVRRVPRNHKIIPPTGAQPRPPYSRQPINYQQLDELGHGIKVSGKQTEKTGTIRKHGASIRFGSPLPGFCLQQLLVFTAETHTGSLPAVSCVSVSGPTKLRSQFNAQWRPLLEVVALYCYKASKPDDLQLNEGDIIYMTRRHADGWCEGVCNGREGFFPQNYVQSCN
ncbi:hypothetical protein GOODEAATRI_016852 [Goodea atripinnis]|uniref:SH3 domain-containing protein n=1 Tax=Goodea atripinnis TaxID=208336 RepID=A0ABV0PP80_9TELE